MNKVINKLKFFGAVIGLSTSIVWSSPIVVHAEEEILWENDKDDHHEEDINDFQPDNSIATPAPAPATPEPTQQITIDATNWDPKSEPDAGLEIPDYVQTEAERKGLTTPTPVPSTPTPDEPDTPTPETPSKPEEPTPIPKTGQILKDILLAIAIGTFASTTTALAIASRGFQNDEEALKLIYGDEKEEEESKLTKKRR